MYIKYSLLKKTAAIILVAVCAIALLLALHTCLYRIKIKKNQVIATLSHMVGRPLSVDTVRLDWNGLDPVVHLSHLKVLSNKSNKSNKSIKDLVGRATIELSWWNSLLHWRWMPALVSLDAVHLEVKKISPTTFDIMHIGVWHSNRFTHGERAWYDKAPRWDFKLSNASLLYEENQQKYHFNHLNVDYHFAFTKHAAVDFSGVLSKHQNMKFSLHADFNDLFNQNYAANFHLGLQNVDLSVVRQFSFLPLLFPHWKFNHGIVNGDLIAYWHQQHWAHVKYAGHIRQLHAVLFKPVDSRSEVLVPHPIKVDELALKLIWQRSSLGWKLRIHDLVVSKGHRTLPLHDLVYSLERDKKSHSWERLDFNEFDFKDLSTLVEFLPETIIHHLDIARWEKCRGKLSHVMMEYFSGTHLGDFKADFSSIYMPIFHRIPGVANLSGRLSLTSKGGWVNINSRNAEIFLAGQPKPIWFKHLSAEMFYHQHGQAMSYSLRNILLDNNDVVLSGYADSDYKKGLSPVVNAKLFFNWNNLSHIGGYFPYKWMKPELSRWLATAFVGGKINNGVAEFHGRLADFPFDHGRGVFKVVGDLGHVQLHFSPRWSNVKNMVGRILFEGRSMRVNVSAAQIDGNPVHHLQARIANLAERPQLDLNLDAVATFKDGYQLLRHSLNSIYRRLFSLHVRGLYHLKLALHIPLGKPHHLQYQGDLLFGHNDLNLSRHHFSLHDIAGHLKFSDGAFSSDSLRAMYLGMPLSIRLMTVAGVNKKMFRFVIKGDQNLAQFFRFYHLPFDHFVHGVMHYKAVLNWPVDPLQATTVSIASDLKDVVLSSVPDFIAKNKWIRVPSRLVLTLPSDAPISARFRYGHRLYGEVSQPVVANLPASKVIRLSFGAPILESSCAGVCVSGELSKVNWDKWYHLYRAVLSSQLSDHIASWDRSAQPLKINLLIGQFTIVKHSFKQAHLLVSRVLDDWKVQLNSGKSLLDLRTPNHLHQDWVIKLAHIKLPSIPTLSKQHFTPSQFPSLRIDATDFQYGQDKYSRLYWQSTSTNKGAEILHFQLKAPGYSLHSTGSWLSAGNAGLWLTGQFDFSNIGALLSKRWHSHLLRQGDGVANFSYFSPKPFLGVFVGATLDVNFLLRHAFILVPLKSENKVSLLKLINILDVSAIPEHVLSGFQDLKSKSLHFKQIKGHVALNNNIISVDHLDLDGEAVSLSLDGTINYLTHRCDLLLNVYPDVTSSLPLITGFAAGPFVGTVAWLVNKIIQPRISHAIASRYHIGGAIDDPSFSLLPVAA